MDGEQWFHILWCKTLRYEMLKIYWLLPQDKLQIGFWIKN